MGHVAIQASADRGPGTALQVAGIGGLLAAATIHLGLAPAHLALSPVLGLGFLATGLAQAAVAGALVVHFGRPAVLAAVVISTIALIAYAVDVTVGLPGVSHAALHTEVLPHGAAHLPGDTGRLEPSAIAGKAAEIVTLLTGLALYRRRSA